ncbi:hypothetical protein ACTQ3U_01720 [Oscillospiraceae bacterium LCP25S3_F9]
MEQLKKVPKFVFVLLGAIVVAIVFWIFIGMSLINNAPTMINEHNENVKKIAEYDTALSQQDKIEAEIKKNQAEYDKKQKELFVDLETCTKEIEQYCSDRNITLKNYSLGEPQNDKLNRTSNGGYPVKSVSITLNYSGNYETALSMLKFFEQKSKGCYYVNSCSISGGEGSKSDDGDVSMSITLYYFDTTASTTQPTQAATTAG